MKKKIVRILSSLVLVNLLGSFSLTSCSTPEIAENPTQKDDSDSNKDNNDDKNNDKNTEDSTDENEINVVVEECENGSISYSVENSNFEKISLNSKVLVSVSPDKGYELDTLKVNDIDITSEKSFIVNEYKTYIIKGSFKLIEEKEDPVVESTIIVKANLGDGNTYTPSLSDFVTSNVEISSVSGSNLFGIGYEGIKFSSSKNPGKLRIEFSSSMYINDITLVGEAYNNDSPVVKVSTENASLTQDFPSSNNYEIKGNSSYLEISSESKNRFILTEIILKNKEGSSSDDSTNDEATIKSEVIGSGSVTFDKESGVKGDKVIATVVANSDYKVSYVLFNNEYAYSSTNQYELTLQAGQNVLKACFVKDNQDVEISDYSELYANTKIKPTRGSYGDIDEYYESVRGLKGPALKEGLNKIIKNHTTYSYSSLSKIMLETDVDPENSNNIILTYEGSKSKSTSYNKEHTWAKFKGSFGTSNGPGTDMHHLRPSDSILNSTRSNYDFGTVTNGKDCGTSYSWSRESMIGNKVNSSTFEPKDEFKGDVARMIFYMATRYEGDDGYVDLEVGINGSISAIDSSKYYTFSGAKGIHGNFNDLYEWATTSIDPVSDFEVNRNNIIDEKYQHNRNLFIDHPEFIIMIYDKNYNGPGALNG